MTDSIPNFLRKRAFSVSSQDEEAFECPATPTKRRSGAAFFMTRVQAATATPSYAARSPESQDSSDEDSEDRTDADDAAPESQDAVLESMPLDSSKVNGGAVSVENITPPRTPTRRSTRQQAAAIAAAANGTAPESLMESPPASLSTSSLATVPRTPPPRLARGMTTPTMTDRRISKLPLGLSTPSTHNNQNSTGLTPSLTRMFREIKDAENSAPSNVKTSKGGKGSTTAEQMKGSSSKGEKPTSDTTPSYSTPRRLGRTMSGLQGIIPPKAGLTVSAGTLKRSMSSPSLPLGSCSATNTLSSLPPPLNYYQEAKSLFRRSAEPHRLIGRETERAVIRTFCQDHMLKAKAGSLYISGQPGTGKTALLKEIMRDMEPQFAAVASHKIQVATVNCMTVKDPRQIYQRVLEEFGFDTPTNKDRDTAATVKALEAIVLAAADASPAGTTTGGKRNSKTSSTPAIQTMYVLILDEVDQLVTKDQEVLYKLFELATLEKSRLTLIGIANALDMTDRFLPRLKAKDVEPQLLNFNPYQVADVRNIILDRLFSLEEMFDNGVASASSSSAAAGNENKKPRIPPLMQRPAIELCARKVAAGTGDLRKALDICRQTIEMVEMEYKKKDKIGASSTTVSRLSPSSSSKVLQPSSLRVVGKMPLQEISVGELENRGSGRLSLTNSSNISTPPPSPPLSSSSSGINPFVTMTLQDAPKATIAHVNKALAAAFGSPAVQMMRALNLHQQILLSVLVVLLKGGKGGDCTVGKLLDQYAVLCKATNKVTAVSKSESQDLINMLEANGLLTVGKAKEERNRKISLVPRESEVIEAVKGQEVVRGMLTRAGVAIEG